MIYHPPKNQSRNSIGFHCTNMTQTNVIVFILISIDRYSRLSAACICETPSGRTIKIFIEQYITLSGMSQTIKTKKGRL